MTTCPIMSLSCLPKNKFGTNNDASWMKYDEDEDEDSLLTFYEPLMITKLISAEFTVLKKVVTDGRTNGLTDRRTNRPTEGQSLL